MAKINSYVLVFVGGIITGALVNYYFFSNLQMAIYIKNLIWITILAGILGGTVNYFFNQGDDFSSSDCLKNIIIGLVAAFLVPLFLNMLSSDLVMGIRGDEKTPQDPYKYLVFFGFCLIAAVSSRAFIQNLSDRILNDVKEAKANSKVAKEKAEDAKEKADKIETSVAPIIEKETEPDSSEPILETEMLGAVSAEYNALSEKKLRVLKALTVEQYTFRSKSGIVKYSNLTGEEVDEILFEFERDGLAKTRDGKNGIRWSITQTGRAVLQQIQEA